MAARRSRARGARSRGTRPATPPCTTSTTTPWPRWRGSQALLGLVPIDPFSPDLRSARELYAIYRRFRAMPPRLQRLYVQLMTMSAADFLDQWFETDVLKATMSASGIIGTFLGVRSPGTAYVLLHHYMGEIDGEFRSWGLARGGTGAFPRPSRQPPGGRRGHPQQATGGTGARRATRRRREAGGRRRDPRRHRGVQPRSPADVHPDLEPGLLPPRSCATCGGLAIEAPRRRSTWRSMPCRALPRCPSRGAPAGRHLHLAQPRVHGSCLRRREGRPLFAASVPGHGDPLAERRHPGPAGKHVLPASCSTRPTA